MYVLRTCHELSLQFSSAQYVAQLSGVWEGKLRLLRTGTVILIGQMVRLIAFLEWVQPCSEFQENILTTGTATFKQLS